MNSSETIALVIFASYFLSIIGLFLVTTSLWKRKASATVPNGAYIKLFSLLAAGSFAHTWYYMFGFLAGSFKEYESWRLNSGVPLKGDFVGRVTSWLVDTDLFESAWATVCNGPMNWWWSEKLCLFTVGFWTLFLGIEGHSRQLKYIWAYMLFGQLVAISVAANIFYVALLVTSGPAPPTRTKRGAAQSLCPPELWISILLALIAVARSPFTDEIGFLPNLLAMHAFIILPLVYSSGVRSWSLRTGTVYAFVTLFSIVLHSWTTYVAWLALPPASRTFTGFIQAAWATLNSHPAQSSITWDVIWSFTSFSIWLVLSPLDRLAVAADASKDD